MLSDAVIVAIIVSVPTTISSILFGIAGIRSRQNLKEELKGDIQLVGVKVDGWLTTWRQDTKEAAGVAVVAAEARGAKGEKDHPS